jgi:hypothetical protein
MKFEPAALDEEVGLSSVASAEGGELYRRLLLAGRDFAFG